MENNVYPPQHSGGGVAFCSNCDKSFIDNTYYEYCPRCGCRIRLKVNKVKQENKVNNEKSTETSSNR